MFLTKKQFLTALGYKQYSSAQRLARRGGVFAPCRLTPDSNPRYHERQLRLIEAVMAGAIDLADANAEWSELKRELALPNLFRLPRNPSQAPELKPVFTLPTTAPPPKLIPIAATREMAEVVAADMRKRYSSRRRKSRAKEAI